MKHYPPIREKTGKKAQVADMFDAIAARYDLANRVLSLGIDRKWRSDAIRLLGLKPGARILDVATGTGDLAIAALQLNPTEVVGVDIAPQMLEHARIKASRHPKGERLDFRLGSAEDLPFEAQGFDAAMVAFGVRNFEDLDLGLDEIFRVLRPGAPVVVLEFSQPRTPPVRLGYAAYSRWVLPLVGLLLSRVRGAYQYLPDSIGAFPHGNEFLERMRRAGFRDTRSRQLTFGIVSLYKGRVPTAK